MGAIASPFAAAAIALLARDVLGEILEVSIAAAVESFTNKEIAARVQSAVRKVREDIEAQINAVMSAFAAVKSTKDIVGVSALMGTQDALTPETIKSIAVAEYGVRFLDEQARTQAEMERKTEAFRALTASAGEWLTGTGPKRP